MYKIFCDECGKEVFTEISEYLEKSVTLFDVKDAICSDCMLKAIVEARKAEEAQDE